LAALLAAAAVTVGWLAQRSSKQPAATGRESMLHRMGVAIEPTSPNAGSVRLDGERWNARSEEPIKPGTLVEVVGIERLTLKVAACKSTQTTNTHQDQREQ